MVRAGVGPLAESGLDEALGLAVCARRVGPGEAVLDVQSVEGFAEAPVAVAASVIGEQAADGDAEAGIMGRAMRKKRMAERWL